MLVTPCPRCHESVRIPDRLLSGQLSNTAQVQCPWCLATLDHHEIEAALPPALIVVGDDLSTEAEAGTPLGLTSSEENEVPGLASMDPAPTTLASGPTALVDDDADLDMFEPSDIQDTSSDVGNEGVLQEHEAVTVDAPEDDEDLDAFLVNDETSDASDDIQLETGGEEEPPMAIYSSDRKRRKKKSMLKTVGSPILGALLALPIGGGLLWYLDALPNLGFYPLDGSLSSSTPIRRTAAPPSSYTPPPMDSSPQGRSLSQDLNESDSESLAPVEMDTSESDMVPESDPAADALAELTQDDASESDLAMEATEAPSEPAAPIDSPAAEDLANTEPFQPSDAPENDLDPVAMNEEPDTSFDLPMTDEAPAETGLPGLPAAISEVTSAEPAEMSPMEDPVKSPTTDATSDLSSSVDEIGMVLDRLESLDAEDPKFQQAVVYAYGMMSRVSSDANSDDLEQLQPLVDRIIGNTPLFVSFARQVPAWIDTPQETRQTDGAMILGKIEATEEENGYQVRLMNKKAYPVRFADDVDPQTLTMVAFGKLDAEAQPASFEIDWMKPVK
ncbi:hypothetical protein LOC71_03150 [Rhodopirellula sp. JC740]|uniref:Serine repeat-containing antigen n=1 Tax=Rhodopirellula halodulae TaxID=2894198 RepID=A0ABS8NEA5_9BACT|nr:hypothetical protein [Rhodopirellula sp. JC740]MCC9641257.1 hypothetical protein [Rhodopirellula sp. JC740]